MLGGFSSGGGWTYTRSVLAHVSGSLDSLVKFCGMLTLVGSGPGRGSCTMAIRLVEALILSGARVVWVIEGPLEGDFWAEAELSLSPSPLVEPVLPSSSLSLPWKL